MSNTLAIAAVTATLKKILSTGIGATADLPPSVPSNLDLGNAKVSARPPDKARQPTDTANQLNLFLYLTTTNAAWRNANLPGQTKPGESRHPPVALTLHYLITAYGNQDEDVAGHVLLGQAMRVLQDHSVFGPADIQDALPGADLHDQIERVRVTPAALSPEEMSKLWTTFQTSYRVSTAYQVSVVLIDSKRGARTPLPVLKRGETDQGVIVQSGVVPPFPTIEEVILPGSQPSALPGDTLTLDGHHLAGNTVALRFEHPRLEQPIQLAAAPGATATRVQVVLPDDPPNWPAGFYTVAAVITIPTAVSPVRVTNKRSFALAPQITSGVPATLHPDTNGDVTLTIGCKPVVRPVQRAVLLLGDREVPAAHETATSSLTFAITDAALGQHFVRLRIDGVDSQLVQFAGDPPKPQFDANQRVEIAP